VSASVTVVQLGEAVKPTRPRVKPTDYPELPFIGMEHIEAHSMKLLGTVSARTMKSAAVHFKPGDVLYGRLRPYLNKVYRPSFEGLCSAEFIVLPENDRIDGAYLQYFLNSGAFVRYATHLNAGDRPRVDFDQLAAYKIPLPGMDDQRRVVAEIEKQFSRLDEAVRGLERVDASLIRYKTAVLTAALQGRLVPTEAELALREGRSYETGAHFLERILKAHRSIWKGKGKYREPAQTDASKLQQLPQGWVWTSVDCVGDVLLGRQRAPQYLTGKYYRPYLRVANVKDDRLEFSDVEEMDFEEEHFQRYRLQPSDILVSEGQSPELLGQSAIFKGFSHPICFQKTLHRFRPIPDSVSSEFAQIVFRSHTRSGIFRKLGSITTNIAHLTLEKFKAAPFPLPPLAEQHRIVAEVERVLSVGEKIETQILANLARAESVRRAVLRKAFSV